MNRNDHSATISNAKRYCAEDISKIENFDQMIADTTQRWDCHHRREMDENKSSDQLIEEGRYYNVPAAELIFLTVSDHTSLHMKGVHTGVPLSDEHKQHIKAVMNRPDVKKKHIEAIKAAMNRPDVKQKISKKVDQFTLDGEFVQTWPSVRQAGKELGICHICSCCKGKRKSAGGFVWKYHTSGEHFTGVKI